MIRKWMLFFVLIAALAIAKPAMGASASATMTVTATVIATCTITSGNLSFGNYDAVGANATAPLNGTAAIKATCTQGAAATVDIDQGLNASGSGNSMQRRMKGTGTNYLSYSIYQDSAHSKPWGSKTSGTTVSVTGAGGTTPVTLTAYGSVPSAQNAPVGSYTDSVAVTINY
ncbi:MAG TPA: spore coat U domain-containing protein [Candidatus Acidoferrum sp.]|nr:spore coat U domain-containing protein [Candidatus Acidoferrum sp.]